MPIPNTEWPGAIFNRATSGFGVHEAAIPIPVLGHHCEIMRPTPQRAIKAPA